MACHQILKKAQSSKTGTRQIIGMRLKAVCKLFSSMENFSAGKVGQASYQKVTEMQARFIWGPKQAWAFQELKNWLRRDAVMVPHDITLDTRLYVDSSPVGNIQATMAQKHIICEEH